MRLRDVVQVAGCGTGPHRNVGPESGHIDSKKVVGWVPTGPGVGWDPTGKAASRGMGANRWKRGAV